MDRRLRALLGIAVLVVAGCSAPADTTPPSGSGPIPSLPVIGLAASDLPTAMLSPDASADPGVTSSPGASDQATPTPAPSPTRTAAPTRTARPTATAGDHTTDEVKVEGLPYPVTFQSPVGLGEHGSISIQAPAQSACWYVITYPSGRTASNAHTFTETATWVWTFYVFPDVGTGTANVSLWCQHGGFAYHGTGSFVIGPAPTPTPWPVWGFTGSVSPPVSRDTGLVFKGHLSGDALPLLVCILGIWPLDNPTGGNYDAVDLTPTSLDFTMTGHEASPWYVTGYQLGWKAECDKGNGDNRYLPDAVFVMP